MNRLVALGAVLAFVSVCQTAPQISTVVVEPGKVGFGVISGATFGPGSFSMGLPGRSNRGQTHVYVNEDGPGSEQIFIQTTNHKVQQDDNLRPQHDNGEPKNSGGTNSVHTQKYPVKPLTTLFNTGQGGMPGQGGREGGSIVIGAVVLPNHENNKENKVNKQALDASAIDATYASNSGNKGVAFSSGASIAIGIAQGNFGQGTMSFNNKRPGAYVPQQQSAANNGNIIQYFHQNTENEAPFSIGHGVAIFGANSGNKELSSLGNGFSTGGQGSIAIGAITGGHFGEGTFSPNNKRYQNTENGAPFSVGHGVSVYSPDDSALKAIFGANSGNKEISSVVHGFSTDGQGNVAIGAITGGHFGKGSLSFNKKRPGAKHDSQSSTGYNAYSNDESWIWNR